MKSVQLVAPRTMEVRTIADPPEPAPGEILVRVRAVGICGSDMHWYAEGGIGAMPAVYPQILGHEPAGDVAAVGKGVALKPGRRVALEPSITCGHCEFCRSGHHNNCVRSVFMGSPQSPGFFREYVVVPEHNAVPIPDSISYTAATVLEPLAVMLHILELVDIHLGDTVCIMGAGPIGLLTASVARIAGASKIFIADKLPHRLAVAGEMGADCAVNTAEASLLDAVMDQTGGRGVDLVFDAAAAIETINNSIAVARLGGKVILIGIPSERQPAVDLHTAMAKELSLQTVKRSNHNAHGAIDLMTAGKITDRIVSHRYPLERTPEAFDTLHHYRDGVVKSVIEIA